ncbi:GNAT family N-acetyltransferase [Nocardia yamanashiensis]|uniref:GNAT family N-acetyltransferase n=1 Tax=Nocardia yamanashiensis TaxID=209247 RepID=UPI00082C768F|nr:GNAT family N-acetyltransferase [Nocardia yamanashiensis]
MADRAAGSQEPALRIRDYRAADKAYCLRLIEGNTPEFFAPDEIAEFAAFLEDPRCAYYVVEAGGEVVGCGGWVVRADGSASLCWGMVERSRHRSGIGSYLFRERLRRIRADGTASHLLLVTSQHSRPFFERMGFQATGVEPDGFAAGLDSVNMRLELR